MSKRYTAQEMREVAEQIDDECADAIADERTIASAFDVDTAQTLRDMLRQAADEKMRMESLWGAIEKEFKKQSICRSCEWRGKSIRSEPACPCDKDENYSVYEIDIIDRLRQAADLQERKKDYEYTVIAKKHDGAVFLDTEHFSTLEGAVKNAEEGFYDVLRYQRREVGKWEEVKNDNN